MKVETPAAPAQDPGDHPHDVYLLQVKAPEESKYPWDYATVVKTIPAAEAFPSVAQQKCPLVTSR